MIESVCRTHDGFSPPMVWCPTPKQCRACNGCDQLIVTLGHSVLLWVLRNGGLVFDPLDGAPLTHALVDELSPVVGSKDLDR